MSILASFRTNKVIPLNWIQIHSQVAKADVELTEAIFYRYGAQSILLENATEVQIFEPMPGKSPLWDEVVVIGLFDADDFKPDNNNELTIENIQSHLNRETTVQRTWITNLEDKAWERVWMDHYHPIQCAENLWIIPKWLEAPNPSATNVLMDPGLAFGTGYHASTQLCLSWLAHAELTDKLVVDYGCGSGILGISALKLGAKKVYAVDIDPQAVTATQQNAELNDLSQNIQAYLPDAFNEVQSKADFPKPDVLVANILAKPLKQLAPYFANLCQSGTKLVLAGLIEPQREDIIQLYSQWFEDFESDSLPENWIRLSATRK